MFGNPDNNNTELRSDATSGDVSEVESGLEVTESEMDDDFLKELDESVDSYLSDKKIPSFDKEHRSDTPAQQRETLEQVDPEKFKNTGEDDKTDLENKKNSFADKSSRA